MTRLLIALLLLPFASVTVAPSPSAPLCAVHDPSVYHALWNDVLGCHYDHEHGDMDFAQATAHLGLDVLTLTGAEISYPWQTPDENALKHGGYKWTFKTTNEDPCIPAENGPNGTDGFAVEFHARGNGVEHMHRVHSSFIAVVICNTSGGRGVLATGGWQDYGQRTSGYQGLVLALPDQPQPSYPSGLAPYVALSCYNDVGSPDCGAKATHSDATWVSRPQMTPGSGHVLAQLLFRARDTHQWVNGSTRQSPPPTFRWVCGNAAYNPAGCRGNNTTATIHQVFGVVPDAWDMLDGLADGKVTYVGFTDRWGNVVSDCLSVSLDCVPLYLRDVPIGGFSTTFDDALLAFSIAALPERDIYFCSSAGKGAPSAPYVCTETSYGATPSGWLSADN